VLAKHSKSFSLLDSIAVGVDRMQRNFEPMRKQVKAWQRTDLVDVTAKMLIYEAFIAGSLDAPRHLARRVHDLYFEPKYEEFRPRTIWSLSNAFTSAFKELDPIPQFKATAKLGQFLGEEFVNRGGSTSAVLQARTTDRLSAQQSGNVEDGYRRLDKFESPHQPRAEPVAVFLTQLYARR